MVEAVAAAAGLPAGDVRRAAMLAGDLGAVARAALERRRGRAARASRSQLFRPVQPMLAQPADDVADALAQLGTRRVRVEARRRARPGAQGGRRGARVYTPQR